MEYLKCTLPPAIEPEFYDFLGSITAAPITVHAIDEGSVVFPRVPLLRLEGPLIIVQLLETTLLTLVNYARYIYKTLASLVMFRRDRNSYSSCFSLMATNAARYRMAAGKHISLLEFGLRRAQGPDGGLSASKYAYIGKLLSRLKTGIAGGVKDF